MKQFLLALITVFVAHSAFAVFDMGHTSQPISAADMDVLSATGIYKGIENVRLEKWNQNLSTFFVNATDLDRNRYSYRLAIEDSLLHLIATQKVRGACGSTYITLQEQLNTLPSIPSSSSFTVTLIDHSTRVCKDLKRYRWELIVKYTDTLRPENNGKLLVGGNPQAVYTIMTQ